jgi:DNA polymerase III delta subunit
LTPTKTHTFSTTLPQWIAQRLALREQRVWGNKERLFERVLPRLSDGSLAQLLQSAHQVDGIVKGLNSPTGRPPPGKRWGGWP